MSRENSQAPHPTRLVVHQNSRVLEIEFASGELAHEAEAQPALQHEIATRVEGNQRHFSAKGQWHDAHQHRAPVHIQDRLGSASVFVGLEFLAVALGVEEGSGEPLLVRVNLDRGAGSRIDAVKLALQSLRLYAVGQTQQQQEPQGQGRWQISDAHVSHLPPHCRAHKYNYVRHGR